MSERSFEFTLSADVWSTVLLETVLRNQALLTALLHAQAETLAYLRDGAPEDVRDELYELVNATEAILKGRLYASCGQLPEALRRDLDSLLGDSSPE